MYKLTILQHAEDGPYSSAFKMKNHSEGAVVFYYVCSLNLTNEITS